MPRDAITPRLAAAFALVYLVWGSTYLAIRQLTHARAYPGSSFR